MTNNKETMYDDSDPQQGLDWRGQKIVPGHPEYVEPATQVDEAPAPMAPTIEERVVALEATVVSLRDRVQELIDGKE